MSFRTRTTPRRVQGGVNVEESRRKREDAQFELRKAARDEQLQKRRMRGSTAPAATQGSTKDEDATAPNASEIMSLRGELACNDLDRLLVATRRYRKILSIAEHPPIQQVIDAGVVPRFVQLLKAPKEALVFEAAWALTNIASGSRTQTKTVLESGAVPMFVELLRSKNKDVKEQAVWALGNIAGDCSQFRDYVLSTGALRRLMQLCAPPHNSMALLRNAVWVISNLCRGRPQPPFEAVKPAIVCLSWLLANSNDEEVLTDAAWAVSYLTDDSTEGNQKIQAVLQAGMAPHLVKLLGHHLTKIQTPVLRTIGNIVTGTDRQTQEMLNKGVLGQLIPLLVSQKRTIRKETCWTISNITAGNSDQIQRCIQESVLPPLITVLRSDEFNVQKEACWALSNITNNGKPEHIMYLVKQGLLPPLCDILSCPDSKIVLVALEGLENTLRVGQEQADRTAGDNHICDIIEECGGVDQLEKLQRHDCDEVFTKAQTLLSKYFGAESEEESLAMVPKSTQTEFSFGSGGFGSNDFSF